MPEGMPVPAAATPEELVQRLAQQRQISTDPLEEVVADGKVVKLRKPGGANYLKAIEMAGQATQLITMFEIILSIQFIDDAPQSPPTSKAGIYTIADVVGRRGMDDLINWYQNALFPEITETQEKYPNVDPTSPEFQLLATKARTERVKK